MGAAVKEERAGEESTSRHWFLRKTDLTETDLAAARWFFLFQQCRLKIMPPTWAA